VSNIALTFASGPYDRMQALREGAIRPTGIDLTYLTMQPAEIFWRMLQYREFDISEMSMSNYLMAASRESCPFIALPVFPSRVFRHGYIFINADKGIKTPKDLIGRRAGVPEYSQTAAVHARAVLEHEYGVLPSAIEWVQGRVDRAGVSPPPNVRIQQAPAGSELSDMLERGEIDFLVTGNNPASFRRRSPKVRRLFPNYRELEIAYFKKTRIYPIMHLVVIRKDVFERHPWVALSMYKALRESKEYCCRTMQETGSSKVSLAFLQSLIEEEKEIFGDDWYPYGVEPNRPSIDAAIRFGYEQGLCPRMPSPEELFAPSTLRDIPLGEGQFIW
jgi:4,5-dihydroxyphthalate decarboxylase